MSDDRDEEPPTAEELAQAEALANESKVAPEALLETAALLRLAGSAGTMSPERTLAVKDRISSELDKRRPRARRHWRWLAPTLAAAAAAVLVVVGGPASRRAPSTAEPVPPAPASLLRAQADAARKGPPGLAALDREMDRYRAALFASLRSRGGARR